MRSRARTARSWHPRARPDAPPAKIGPYFVLEPIGEGGMARVYLAEQIEPVRRRDRDQAAEDRVRRSRP
jgi:hypothetical protein